MYSKTLDIEHPQRLHFSCDPEGPVSVCDQKSAERHVQTVLIVLSPSLLPFQNLFFTQSFLIKLVKRLHQHEMKRNECLLADTTAHLDNELGQ